MDNPFSKARIKHLTSLSFEQFFNLTYRDFLVSEIEYLISETPMRDEDKRIAVALYIKGMGAKEIADRFSMSYDTAKAKRRELREAMIATIVKLFFDYEEATE